MSISSKRYISNAGLNLANSTLPWVRSPQCRRAFAASNFGWSGMLVLQDVDIRACLRSRRCERLLRKSTSWFRFRAAGMHIRWCNGCWKPPFRAQISFAGSRFSRPRPYWPNTRTQSPRFRYRWRPCWPKTSGFTSSHRRSNCQRSISFNIGMTGFITIPAING